MSYFWGGECALSLAPSLLPPTPGRGANDDTLAQPPCGGFNTAKRIEFGLASRVAYQVQDGSGYVVIYWYKGSNPNFGNVSATPYTPVGTFVPQANVSIINPEGTASPTLYLDTPLNLLNVTDGDTGTLQVIYYSDDPFYQCQDVAIGFDPNSTGTRPAAQAAWLIGVAVVVLAMTVL